MKFLSALAFAGVVVSSPISDLLGLRSAAATFRSTRLAGAFKAAPSGSAFVTVTGTFNIPNATQPSGSTQDHISVLDIGIGANGPHGGCLVGTGNSVNHPNAACLAGWEAGSGQFFSFNVTVNDQVTVTSHVVNSTAGTVTFRNSRTGQVVSRDVMAPNSTTTTRGENAAFEVLVPPGTTSPQYQNFGTVNFAGISASTNNAGAQPVTGADTYDIFDSTGRQISQTSIVSGSAVSVTYVGPR